MSASKSLTCGLEHVAANHMRRRPGVMQFGGARRDERSAYPDSLSHLRRPTNSLQKYQAAQLVCRRAADALRRIAGPASAIQADWRRTGVVWSHL